MTAVNINVTRQSDWFPCCVINSNCLKCLPTSQRQCSSRNLLLILWSCRRPSSCCCCGCWRQIWQTTQSSMINELVWTTIRRGKMNIRIFVRLPIDSVSRLNCGFSCWMIDKADNSLSKGYRQMMSPIIYFLPPFVPLLIPFMHYENGTTIHKTLVPMSHNHWPSPSSWTICCNWTAS